MPFFPGCGFVSCLVDMSRYLAALLIHLNDVAETNKLIIVEFEVLYSPLVVFFAGFLAALLKVSKTADMSEEN